MKNRRKKREAFGEHSYWQSYSDMMAALLLVFVLIIAITLAIYRQKTVDLDQARLDLNAAQTKLDQAALELEDFLAKIELSNEELAFKENGQRIAYISNQILVITNAEIRNKLSLGNESRGWFDFIPRETGNLSIKWRGPVS